MGRAHSSIDTYSYKWAAGLNTLLVQYLLMQNRHLTGEEKSPKTREEWRKVNGGMPLLTDLCHGDDPGAKGSRNLYLWTGSHVRVSRSSGGSLSTLRDPREPHKHTRWNDT